MGYLPSVCVYNVSIAIQINNLSIWPCKVSPLMDKAVLFHTSVHSPPVVLFHSNSRCYLDVVQGMNALCHVFAAACYICACWPDISDFSMHIYCMGRPMRCFSLIKNLLEKLVFLLFLLLICLVTCYSSCFVTCWSCGVVTCWSSCLVTCWSVWPHVDLAAWPQAVFVIVVCKSDQCFVFLVFLCLAMRRFLTCVGSPLTFAEFPNHTGHAIDTRWVGIILDKQIAETVKRYWTISDQIEYY